MGPENDRPRVYTVSALTEEIQSVFDEHFDFIWVEGEISNFSAPVSGHYYMVLKDERSQVRAVMFRFQARHLKFVPENGMKVLAQGKVGIYPPRGEYQIVLDYLEPMGVGALALAFEQLKKKLASQGVFDEEIKKPLPFLPKKIAVITSPTGAAIRDFLKVIHRRFANLEIVVVPVRVQGDGAAEEIIEALKIVHEELNADVAVLTRGGGSLEDLWEFNSEELALAIRRSIIPVVSAVGHEIDITISDLAADFRAPTPSAAAELLVIEKQTMIRHLNELGSRLETSMRLTMSNMLRDYSRLAVRLKDPKRRLADMWMRLDEIYSRLLSGLDRIIGNKKIRLASESRALQSASPVNMAASIRQRLNFSEKSIANAMKRRISEARMSISAVDNRLSDLSPLSVLARGYSIARILPEETILKDASDVKKGNRLKVLLAKGELECKVEKSNTERSI